MEKKNPQFNTKKQSLLLTLIFIFGGISLILVVWILKSVPWTGFQEKTLWDWLDVFLVPAVFLLFIPVAIWQMKNAQEKAAFLERELALELIREEAMKSYMELITALVLEKGLGAEVNQDE